MTINRLFYDKRFFLLSAMLASLTSYFWLASRYPALNQKALMGGDLALEDGLSFDAWFLSDQVPEWLPQFVLTFINWLHTNQNGMLFGLAFAVIVMSLLSVTRQYLATSSHPFWAMLKGFFLGAPLGVCVNCAAPIAYGMYRKGVRAETALAMMISSPTLNVIVISMALALLPLHLVVIKLLTTLALIVAAIPLLVRVTPSEARIDAPGESAASCATGESVDVMNWQQTLRWIVLELARNSRYILLKVVPLMLLAGLLGSALITILPWNDLVGLINNLDKRGAWALLIGVALFGLLLPVPIAFDVVIAAVLYNSGVQVQYVAALLFVLGSFSIYSWFVLYRVGAKKLATSLALTILLAGVVAGVASQLYHDRVHVPYMVKSVFSIPLNDAYPRHRVSAPQPTEKPQPLPAPMTDWRAEFSSSPHLIVTSITLEPDDAGEKGVAQAWRMRLVEDAGFRHHPKALIEQFYEPLSHINGVSSADVNLDGWIDLLVTTTNGIHLYMNLGGRFALTALPDYAEMEGLMGAAALVDIDNNGWPDLLFNAADRGTYLSLNTQGIFQQPTHIDSSPAYVSMALAIGDLDRNGLLDVVTGNHNGQGAAMESQEASRNQRLMQRPDHSFEAFELPGMPGETLTALISDLDDDGHVDLLVGNDYDEPDVYYQGSKDGLQQWDRDTLPYTTRTSMSIDSADIDNDLVLETYHVQIAEQGMRRSEVHGEMTIPYTREQCRSGNPDCELLKARDAMRNRQMKGCTSLELAYQKDCVLSIFNQRALQSRMRNQEVKVAKYFERSYEDLLPFFKMQMLDSSVNHEKDADPDTFFPQDIRQKADENMLFFHTSDGYRNEAKSYGVANPGWGWNARFFDLDGDGFQDLYVVNGGFLSNLVMENIWFRNWGGKHFLNASAAVGLNDMEITLSYSSFDADNDGDLDIVTFSDLDHLKYYENVNNPNHHLQIQLHDEIGNSSGIGAKITIFYGKNNDLHQVRELKASGGYMSFDAPVAHFGLGQYQQINRISIRWSTGETMQLDGAFEAAKRYRISRPRQI